MRSRAARLARVVVSAGLGAATLVAAATGALSNACSTDADAGRSTDAGGSDVTCTAGGRTFRKGEELGAWCLGSCVCEELFPGSDRGVVACRGLCLDVCILDGAVFGKGESFVADDGCNTCRCEARDLRVPYDSVIERIVYVPACTRDRVCVDASADAALDGDAGPLPDGPSEAGPD